MKKLLITLSLAIFLLSGNLFAQDSLRVQNKRQNRVKAETKTAIKLQPTYQHGARFIDEDGDGYNDNAPDHDGDGIPNGQDEDYTGAKNRKGNGNRGFVDADGDGINDNAVDSDDDGIPNGQDPDYERPRDGSGRPVDGKGKGKGKQDIKGPKDGSNLEKGNGNCDGTGSKGNKGGGKK